MFLWCALTFVTLQQFLRGRMRPSVRALLYVHSCRVGPRTCTAAHIFACNVYMQSVCTETLMTCVQASESCLPWATDWGVYAGSFHFSTNTFVYRYSLSWLALKLLLGPSVAVRYVWYWKDGFLTLQKHFNQSWALNISWGTYWDRLGLGRRFWNGRNYLLGLSLTSVLSLPRTVWSVLQDLCDICCCFLLLIFASSSLAHIHGIFTNLYQ